MAKAGAKSKYETHVKPYFDKITEMLNGGASEEQVAVSLGISYSSFNNYKSQYEELAELCKQPRVKLVDDLRSALIKKALGMKIERKKTYIKKDADGREAKYTEIMVDELPPDTTAIFGALNLYDCDYVRDRKQYELKQQELELRKMLAENQNW